MVLKRSNCAPTGYPGFGTHEQTTKGGIPLVQPRKETNVQLPLDKAMISRRPTALVKRPSIRPVKCKFKLVEASTQTRNEPDHDSPDDHTTSASDLQNADNNNPGLFGGGTKRDSVSLGSGTGYHGERLLTGGSAACQRRVGRSDVAVVGLRERRS